MIRKFILKDNEYLIETQNRIVGEIYYHLLNETKDLYLQFAELFGIENGYTKILEQKHSIQTNYLDTFINLIAFKFRETIESQDTELFRNEEEMSIQHLNDWRVYFNDTINNLFKDNFFLKNLVIMICEEKVRENGDFDFSKICFDAGQKLCYFYLQSHSIPDKNLLLIDFNKLEDKYGFEDSK